MSCPTYAVPPSFQLKEPITGRFDCTAYSDRVVIATSTCGRKIPTGRIIRLSSDEPIPDRDSPGLNLRQVADVARQYGLYLDVHTGLRKVPWAEYERRRIAGQSTIIQGQYAVIANSKYDAGRGFRGGHAIAETTHSTYQHLDDGRARGVWKWDASLYPRALMRKFAGALVTDVNKVSGAPITVGDGYVWAAFGRDVVPNYRAVVTKQTFWLYFTKPDPAHPNRLLITGRKALRTGGFSATCLPSQGAFWDVTNKSYSLVKLTSGSLYEKYKAQGCAIAAVFSTEVP